MCALVVFDAAASRSDHNQLKQQPERQYRLGERLVTVQQRWKDDRKGGSKLGFGASVYDSAFLLADFCQRHVDVGGKRVVELGAGLGLTSIGVALCEPGPAEVVVTDGDGDLLKEVTEGNLASNVPAGVLARSRVRCEELLWGDARVHALLDPPFDVVLVADCAACVYEEAFAQLVGSIVALSGPQSRVLMGYQRRHHSEDTFFRLLDEAGFDLTAVPRDRLHPDFAHHATLTIFDLHRRPTPTASTCTSNSTTAAAAAASISTTSTITVAATTTTPAAESTPPAPAHAPGPAAAAMPPPEREGAVDGAR